MVNKRSKRVNERVVLLSVFILLAIFALGILFMANPQMTANVVFEEYESQTSCESAGYTWVEIYNETETCINETIYSNVTYDCEPCLEPEVINETSGDCVSWSSCINETSTEEETCIYEVIRRQCEGDICDSDNLNLCLDETTCNDSTGYWYNDECNAEECVPDTCASLDSDCGTFDDGCGGTLDCGECENDTSSDESDTSTTSSTNDESSFTTGDTIESSCVSEWQCDDWTECVEGTQTRICTDINNCILKEGEPSLSQACEVVRENVIIEETCFDEIKNQDEKGIDCGGVCEKKCSIFTMVGSVIDGPIESGKEFIQKNKTIVLIISGVLFLGLAGFVTFGILKKKKILPKINIKSLFKKKNSGNFKETP